MKTWPETSIEEIVESEPELKLWLETFDQKHKYDWTLEYSGNVYGLYLAWKAGRASALGEIAADAKCAPGPSDVKCAFCDEAAGFIIRGAARCAKHRSEL